ncbi:MAG: ammonium transporter [Caldilineaceae bacterium]
MNALKLSFIGKALLVTLVALMLSAGSAFAQNNQPDATALATDALVSINAMWVIVAAIFIFLMQAGFALVETGFTRAKNVANTMSMVLMVFAVSALCYWAVGFAFQFGGINRLMPDLGAGEWIYSPTSLGDWGSSLQNELSFGNYGLLGLNGFMLSGIGANFGILAFFFFQFCFAAACVAIPTGAVAERMKWGGYLVMTILVSALIYPLIGNWGWGGGWLANLGRSMNLGNGLVDFAGSGVIHMTGGAVALAGALVIGPRIGKYNRDGSANTIAGHNVPMGVLGTFILVIGWFAFNSGSALGFTGASRDLAIVAVVNTLLAVSAAGVSAMLYMMFASPNRRPDPVMTVNGLLAGAVSITGPCAFVDPWAAVVIGLAAGLLVCWSAALLEKLKIDDPVGAVPVHLVCGAWGLLAVGIFANGNPQTAYWNGVSGAVTGALNGGIPQLIAQLISLIAITVVAFGLAYIVFKVMQGAGLLRVSADVELAGMDVAEMGVEGYPPDFEPSIESLRDMAAVR